MPLRHSHLTQAERENAYRTPYAEVSASLLQNFAGFVVSCLKVVAFTQQNSSYAVNEALTVNGDGAQRSKDIHWPDGFHPEQADLFAHNEIVIHASCAKVFANIADAQAWPSWYPNSHNVPVLNSSDGKLHRGARFSWDTFGLHIESRVHEFVPGSRIGWFGDGTEKHEVQFCAEASLTPEMLMLG